MKRTILCIILLLGIQFLQGQETDTVEVRTDSTVVTTITTTTTTTTTTTSPATTSDTSEKSGNTAVKQEEEQTTKKRRDTRPIHQRISFGLGGSFWANSREMYIEAHPSVAYRFPKMFITGVGYRYIWRNQFNSDPTLRTYGPTVFGRMNFIKSVYGWTEYEILKSEYLVEVPGQTAGKNSTTIDSWFVGLGYVKSVGRKGRGGISVQVLYNALYYRDSNSPYYSPWVYRVGYYF